MHPLVRDLYKRFLIIGKDYPGGGWQALKPKVKRGFYEKKELVDEVEIKRAVSRGRYMVRELVGITQLKKYRSMKSRYEDR
jgi:hypothetical protein